MNAISFMLVAHPGSEPIAKASVLRTLRTKERNMKQRIAKFMARLARILGLEKMEKHCEAKARPDEDVQL